MKYFFDTINKRDLILLISFDYLKIYDISKWSLIVYIKESIYNKRGMNSCILNNKNQNFIITSNYYSDCFRIYDFNGNKIKNIKTPNAINIEIETYQDYIISGNINCCTTYNFNTKKFKKYETNKDMLFQLGNIVAYKNKKGANILIAKCEDNLKNYNIFIWDFKPCLPINKIVFKIITYDSGLRLWNENYFIVGTGFLLKIFDISKNKFIKEIKSTEIIYNYKKIAHPKYGECLMLIDSNNTIKILFD